MDIRFKIGDWVAHEATVPVKKADEPDVEQPYRGHRERVNPTKKATYIGRVKKISITEQGVVYYVVFGPEDNWKQLVSGELMDAAVILNPPRMDPEASKAR